VLFRSPTQSAGTDFPTCKYSCTGNPIVWKLNQSGLECTVNLAEEFKCTVEF